eukprot:g54884.t1
MSSAEEFIKKAEAELASAGITGLTIHRHAEVKDVEGLKQVAGNLPGLLCKNLFVKDKKKKFFLVVAKHDAQVKLGSVGSGGSRIDDKNLQEILGVTAGSVTPLAVCNDKENKVTVVLDKALDQGSTLLNVHPLTNAATVGIPADQLKQYIAAKGHKLEIIDFAAGGAGGGGGAKPSKPSGKAAAATNQGGQGKSKAAAVKPAGTEEESVQQLAIISKKNVDFPNWYKEIMTKSELIEYYDISGCYILRPWAYEMWECIQRFFDGKIKELGVKNTYFPLFVSESALCKEEDHIEGFSAEVAWVTKSGNTDLERPIAVRPTSETIMYPAFKKWIRGHRDLPLKINQWSNVVRWEFSHPTPFIRTREFLWQEGHSAFATYDEAAVEVLQILDLYARVYQDLMAVPVIKGKKTEKEKFAGGYYTTTVEAFVPATGRSVQGATSHCLGQNFAKMFKIDFEDEKGEKKLVWQNSWGLTTRTIGVMIMVHGDDQGLVLPPRIAPIQAVLIAIETKNADTEGMRKKCREYEAALKAVGVRAYADLRTNYNAGWKMKHWSVKGVPLLLKIGSRELAAGTVEVARRDDDSKQSVNMSSLVRDVPLILRTMQNDMFERAKAKTKKQIRQAMVWKEFLQALADKCIVLSPWCARKECEESIKARSGEESSDIVPTQDKQEEDNEGNGLGKLSGAAKSLCIPFEQPPLQDGTLCVGCSNVAKMFCLFGRSY